jgi:uncharacterized protein (TIGR03118 family)
MNRMLSVAALASAMALIHPPLVSAENSFRETDLVSDKPGRAAQLDVNLVNPWGIVLDSRGQVRVADNGSGLSTVYARDGTALTPTITVPPAGSGNPSGMAINSTSSFFVSNNGKTGRSRFLFVSEDGTISAWSPDVHPDSAITVVTTPDAVYKGLAIASTEAGSRLYAANFRAGTIDVFDGHFAPVSLPAGAFVDPNLPAGYAPFNIANLRGRLYVTYAFQDANKHDDVPGAGMGFVNVFDFKGNLVHRLITQGPLDAPWGLVIAPDGFGPFGHALLVGNFGNGWINAFDPGTGNFLGSLEDSTGAAIAIDGLWGLAAGSGGSGEDGDDDSEDSPIVRPGLRSNWGSDDGDSEGSSTIFFTAGIEDEGHGLLGTLSAKRTHEGDEDEDDQGKDEDRALRVTVVRGNPSHLADHSGVQFQVSTLAPTVVRLRIYDVAGRLVAEPLTDVSVNGSVVTQWNESDKRGQRVRAGSYFYRAVGGAHAAGGHLVVVP